MHVLGHYERIASYCCAIIARMSGVYIRKRKLIILGVFIFVELLLDSYMHCKQRH